jgi:radical SAM protein with 4Fe4S-binding SPASM domain
MSLPSTIPEEALTRPQPIPPLAPQARRRLKLADRARVVDRQASPGYAVWELTLRCDLACTHCSSRAGRARPDELTTPEALDLVEQLGDLGILEVTLIGGEAYLRSDWLLIVEAIRRRGMECTMVSGGRGITRERARAARDAGLMSVSISVDGAPVTHDVLRGLHGSHAAAMAAMGALVAEGVPVSANTQIGRRNRKELEDVFVLVTEAGAHSWQIQLTVAAGRAADDPSILLEPYHLLEVMPAIARIKTRADAADLHIWPGNNLGYFGPFEALLRGHLPGGRRGSCGAGRFSIGIESDGSIKACPSLPSDAYVGGNVRDDRLIDIWQRAEPLRFTRGDRMPELWGHCASCYHAGDCLAGCSWTAHSLFARRGNNPFCHHRALELLRRARRERLVRTAPAPGKPFDHARFEIVEENWPPAELERARAVATGKEDWLLE